MSTAGLTRQAGGSYQATITVSNSGGAAAQRVALTSVVLGASQASPTPQSLGTVAPGSSASATLSLPASAGASGSRVIEKITGTYSGATFGGSLRIALP